jgi:hypothetical protein
MEVEVIRCCCRLESNGGGCGPLLLSVSGTALLPAASLFSLIYMLAGPCSLSRRIVQEVGCSQKEDMCTT